MKVFLFRLNFEFLQKCDIQEGATNFFLNIFAKCIFDCLKLQLSNKITKNEQHYVYKWRHGMSEVGHGMKFLFKCSSYHIRQLYSLSTFPKKQVSWLKTAVMVKFVKKDKMTFLNDATHQEHDMVWRIFLFQNVSLNDEQLQPWRKFQKKSQVFKTT